MKSRHRTGCSATTVIMVSVHLCSILPPSSLLEEGSFSNKSLHLLMAIMNDYYVDIRIKHKEHHYFGLQSNSINSGIRAKHFILGVVFFKSPIACCELFSGENQCGLKTGQAEFHHSMRGINRRSTLVVPLVPVSGKY